MILIADGGSTTCTWCLLGNAHPTYFTTEDYNPYFSDTPAIAASLTRSVPTAVRQVPLSAIHYYGSGVLSSVKV